MDASPDGFTRAELPPDLIPLREAARSLPSTRVGKRVSYSTMRRWSSKGLADGRRLPILKVGGGLYVSRAALAAFAQPRGVDPAPAVVRTPAQRRRSHEEAGRLLDRAGIGGRTT